MKISRMIYLAAVYVFMAGVFVQVFLAGMVIEALKLGWDPHRTLGHALALPLLVMLPTQYFGRLPRPMKYMTWGLFVNYALQADVVIFLRLSAPVVSAFHPVLALVDVILGFLLLRRITALMRAPKGVEAQPEPPKISP